MEYSVEKIVAEIGRTKGSVKRLTLTSWKGNPAKLELRIWLIKDNTEMPGRGVTMTDEEAKALADALNAYLSGLQ